MVECELSDGWSVQLANVYSRDGTILTDLS
jgi:hypothetical protein